MGVGEREGRMHVRTYVQEQYTEENVRSPCAGILHAHNGRGVRMYVCMYEIRKGCTYVRMYV